MLGVAGSNIGINNKQSRALLLHAQTGNDFFKQLKDRLANNDVVTILTEASFASSELLGTHLSISEQDRAKRYLHKNDQQLSTVAHGLKRLVLSTLLNCPAQQLEFSCTGKGKPICLNEHAPHFNLSHSENWVAMTLAQHANVGVDIEFKRDMDYALFANSVFTAEEYKEFEESKFNPDYFLQLWSQKEAISKACGLGLFIDFTKIAINYPSKPEHNYFEKNKINVNDETYYFYSKKFLHGYITVACNIEQEKVPIILYDSIQQGYSY